MIILGCIIGLLIVGRVFSVPLKAILKLIINSILGGLLIFIINLIGGAFEFHVGLNVGTSILVGILGLPRCYFINYLKAVFIIVVTGFYQKALFSSNNGLKLKKDIAIYIKTIYNMKVNSVLSSYNILYEVLNKCTYQPIT